MFSYLTKKLFFAIGSLILIMASYAFYAYYKKSVANRAVGWETTKSAQRPFKPGVVLNGQPPNFEIFLIEPDPSAQIMAKPSESIPFLVNIKISDEKPSRSTTPPTFVFLKMMNDAKRSSRIILSPSALNEQGYFYSGNIIVPKAFGDYIVTVEAEYAIYDTSKGKPILLKPFQKVVKGTTINVGK